MEKRICRTLRLALTTVILLVSAAVVTLLVTMTDVSVSVIAYILAIAAILMLASTFAAGAMTRRFMHPISRMTDDIDRVDAEAVYPEFAPLIERIRSQELEISKQLSRVDNEKNRLSTIINNMDEGLIILDDDLRVIMLNASAYSWLGTTIPIAECRGRHITEVCESGEICDCIERADAMNLSLDGRDLQLHVNHVVSSDEQIGRIGLLLDVTERTQIDRIKQEFTANVSHELKTPLTSISGYAEMIETGMAQGDDTRLFAGRIRRESARMLTLISDIIKLSQLDEATEGGELEQSDLCLICENCMDVLEMSAKRHEVTLSLEGDHFELLASPSQLTELVYNLIDNGISYNHAGGSVKLTLTSNPDGYGKNAIAMLSVSDTGIGISKEHQARVFERFYRVDKSRSKETGGTGLGLAIVKHVAERHNAKIELESKLGEGTTIRVIFYRNDGVER